MVAGTEGGGPRRGGGDVVAAVVAVGVVDGVAVRLSCTVALGTSIRLNPLQIPTSWVP